MNPFILDLITKFLCMGHAVTLGHPTPEGQAFLRHRFGNMLGVKLQVIGLSYYTGASVEHTPVVVLFDVKQANMVLLPDARAIACRFPDGSNPIVIEC